MQGGFENFVISLFYRIFAAEYIVMAEYRNIFASNN